MVARGVIAVGAMGVADTLGDDAVDGEASADGAEALTVDVVGATALDGLAVGTAQAADTTTATVTSPARAIRMTPPFTVPLSTRVATNFDEPFVLIVPNRPSRRSTEHTLRLYVGI